VIICCPKCGKRGTLSRKWVRSGGYYPSYSSKLCNELESVKKRLAQDPQNKQHVLRMKSLQERITGIKYNKSIKRENLDKQIHYRVRSVKYFHYYVGHYDPEMYRRRMEDYRNHKRQSRPNGRKWCKVPVSKYYLLVAKKGTME
jgi:Ni/Co efflux regulator RcnB